MIEETPLTFDKEIMFVAKSHHLIRQSLDLFWILAKLVEHRCRNQEVADAARIEPFRIQPEHSLLHLFQSLIWVSKRPEHAHFLALRGNNRIEDQFGNTRTIVSGF